MTVTAITCRYGFTAGILLMALIAGSPPCSAASRLYPVDGGSVTSGQGWRLDPFGSGRWVFHRGLDIAVPTGTPVYPTQIGTVIYAGDYKGYGKLVVVEHGSGYVTLYGHNSEVLVTPGQNVDTSTVLALSGSTGHSTGPHVHYEVRRWQEQPASTEMRSELEKLVRERIDGWVGKVAAGQGDGDLAIQTAPGQPRRAAELPGLIP